MKKECLAVILLFLLIAGCNVNDERLSSSVHDEVKSRVVIAGSELYHATMAVGFDDGGRQAKQHAKNVVDECKKALALDDSVTICRFMVGTSYKIMGLDGAAEAAWVDGLSRYSTSSDSKELDSALDVAWLYTDLLTSEGRASDGISLLGKFAEKMSFSPDSVGPIIFLSSQVDPSRAKTVLKKFYENKNISYDPVVELTLCDGLSVSRRVEAAKECYLSVLKRIEKSSDLYNEIKRNIILSSQE